MLRRIRNFMIAAIGGAILAPLFHAGQRLVEHAILGWADSEIARWVGNTIPGFQNQIGVAIDWGLPILLATLCLGAAFAVGASKEQPPRPRKDAANYQSVQAELDGGETEDQESSEADQAEICSVCGCTCRRDTIRPISFQPKKSHSVTAAALAARMRRRR